MSGYSEVKMDKDLFKKFILDEINKAIVVEDKDQRKEEIKRMTSDQAMEIWESAFTHISLTSVPGKNYEYLESIGDAYLSAFFLTYIDDIMPKDRSTPSYFTDLRRYWLSKPKLAAFSDELGLNRFVQYDKSLLLTSGTRFESEDAAIRSINEDIFESFFGALIKVSDKLVAEGAGYSNGWNYFTTFFENKKILIPEDKLIPRKTKLKELFAVMKWGDVRYISVGDANDSEITIAVLDRDGNELASGKGNDRQTAEDNAARNAIEILAERGITKDNIAKQKQQVDEELESLKSRILDFLNKNSKIVHGDITFAKLFEGGGSFLCEMRCVKNYGKPNAILISLGKGIGPAKRMAQINTMKDYIYKNNIR